MYVGCSWRKSQGPMFAFAAFPKSWPRGVCTLGFGDSLIDGTAASGRLLGSARAALEGRALRSTEGSNWDLGSDEGEE